MTSNIHLFEKQSVAVTTYHVSDYFFGKDWKICGSNFMLTKRQEGVSALYAHLDE